MNMGIIAQKKHFFSKPNLTNKSKTIAVSLVKTHRKNIKHMDRFHRFHPKNKNNREIQEKFSVFLLFLHLKKTRFFQLFFKHPLVPPELGASSQAALA